MAAEDGLTPTLRGLVAAARSAAGAAYAPYSGFRVGAAALGLSGRVFAGCNVENASYPVTLCAERAAVAAAVAAGERRIVAVAVASGDVAVETVTPCGMCRQFLAEFGSSLTVVSRQHGAWVTQPVNELLPAAFSLARSDAVADVIPGPKGAAAAAGAGVTSATGSSIDVLHRLELRRVARPLIAELEGLARREAEVFGHTGLRVEDLRVISRAGAVYEGVVEGSPVGSCQLVRVFDDPEAAWVVGFYVLREYRGKGFGRALLAAVAAAAGDAGLGRLVLTVGPENTPALNLYQSFGFDVVEILPDFYGPGEDRLLLSCTLIPAAGRPAGVPGPPLGGDQDRG